MPNSGQPTIKKGDTGPAVSRAQQAISRNVNYSITVDGIFGSRTEVFVQKFQAGAGLAPDGIVGPATWAALLDDGAPPVRQHGSREPVVASLQEIFTNGVGFGPRRRPALSRLAWPHRGRRDSG